MTAFQDRVSSYTERVQATLDQWLPPAGHHPARLHEAMRYSAEGGKRLRPLLIYATGEVLGAPSRALDPAAAAVELIHAYSLVHDDLPAMDDDDLRRGRPTAHKKFGEATAILAGDALQSLAFYILAHDSHAGLEPLQRLKMIELLADASGSRGMAGGQQIDLDSVGQPLSVAELEAMHIHKTGALIRACVLMGCYASTPMPTELMDSLDRYGKCLGLAFQIQDDILDVEGSVEKTGKTQGKDTHHNKPTYPAVMGMRAAKARASELFDIARASVNVLGERSEPLVWLARHIEGRDR